MRKCNLRGIKKASPSTRRCAKQKSISKITGVKRIESIELIKHAGTRRVVRFAAARKRDSHKIHS